MVLAELPPALVLGLAAVIGLLFGSFTNVVIYRLPRGESIAFPPSHCPNCSKPIRARDNLPVIGYLLLRGRARCCTAPISWRYPAVEAMGGMWAVAITRVAILDLPGATPLWEVGLSFAAFLALGLILLAALFIDLDHMLLPDVLTLGGAGLGLATSQWLRDIDWMDSAIGAAIGYAAVRLLFVDGYRLLRGHPGMGLGDAKMLMLSGAWFGWVGVLFALMVGSVLGTLTAIVVYLLRGKMEEPEAVRQEREETAALLETLEGEERARLEAELERDPLYAAPASGFGGARLAFGPFLAVATMAYPLVGPRILEHFLLVGS